MSKIKEKCHVCQNIFKSEQPPEFCKYCGADLLNPLNESAQIKSIGIEYDGWSGSLILTNKRLMFVKIFKVGGVGGALGGVIGGIVNAAVSASMQSKGESLGLSIPLGSIQTAEIAKKAFSRVLVISNNDGSQYKLPIPKKHIEEWKNSIIQFNS